MAQTFLGHKVVTTWEDIGIWEIFFDLFEVKTIIELGTGHGGLSIFFALQAYERGLIYHTFDNVLSIDCTVGVPKLLSLRENIHHVDIWEKREEIIRMIGNLPRPILMHFDNGDKLREWRTFAPHLQPGDFCSVHDWGTEFLKDDIGAVDVERILEKECDERFPKLKWYTMWFKRK